MRGRKVAIVFALPVLGFVLLYRSSSNMQQQFTQQKQQQKQPKFQHQRKITLVVRMRGEMANLLSHLVFAKGIQWWVDDHYSHNLTLELVGEHQSKSKWKAAIQDLQKCFPSLRDMFFEGGRWDDDFQIRKYQQMAWVGEENHFDKLMIDRADSDCTSSEELFCLNDQLEFLQNLLLQQKGQGNNTPLLVANNVTRSAPQLQDTNSTGNRYSLPFLVTNRLASFDVLVDQYFDRIKEWLVFDYDACCSRLTQPGPDEVVVHLRNFRAEMRERNYLERGYEELNPIRVAEALLGHLAAGSKVVIVSRGEAYVDQYVKALRDRGLQVRTTPNDHSGVQDFCFLLQTERELVGTMRSTYTRWAALLGRAKRVQLYSMDSSSIRIAQGSDNFTEEIHYRWTRPDLKAKVEYRVFKSNGTP